MSFMSSLFESFLPTAYAEEQQQQDSAVSKDAGESDSGDKGEEAEEPEAAEEEEEEDEEEPEDTAPAIREECGESKACHTFKHHYEECAKRVSEGKTQIEGENCVEELFHFMHCVDDCAAKKVFATLK